MIFERNHESLAILKLPLKPGSSVIGGITFRLFPDRCFCEIVFCAVSSTEQVKGYGSALMNSLKAQLSMRTAGQITHYLTYADNYAIGYFKKQGFSRHITLPREVWAGYIKDYDGGTLMECAILPRVRYDQVYEMLWRQKCALLEQIDRLTGGCSRVYSSEGLPFDREKGLRPDQIPGFMEAGWTEAMSQQMSQSASIHRRGKIYECLKPLLKDLQGHPAAWPFLEPVDGEEVPGYYEVITDPIDLSRMEEKLEADQYQSIEEFVKDMQLLLRNCHEFNEADSIYCKNAKILETFFEGKLKERNL